MSSKITVIAITVIAEVLYTDVSLSDSLISRSNCNPSILSSCTILSPSLFSNSDLRSAVFIFSVITRLPFLFYLLLLDSLAVLM